MKPNFTRYFEAQKKRFEYLRERPWLIEHKAADPDFSVYKLGEGHYGSVFESAIPGFVVKETSENSGWVLWACLCYQLYKDGCLPEWMPEVYSIRVEESKEGSGPFGDGRYRIVALMEKLSPYGSYEINMFPFYSSVHNGIRAFDRLLEGDESYQMEWDREKYGPEYAQMLLKAGRMAKIKHSTLFYDLHSENRMMRGEQPVLTDPWEFDEFCTASYGYVRNALKSVGVDVSCMEVPYDDDEVYRREQECDQRVREFEGGARL